MSAGAIGVYGVVATLVLMGLRVPIAVALGGVSILGIIWMLDFQAELGIISAVPFNFIGNWALTAVPMFLQMGFICTTTGMTNGLFRAMRIFLSRLPGGLAVRGGGRQRAFCVCLWLECGDGVGHGANCRAGNATP